MNGLDRGKVTDSPVNDGPSVTRHDHPRGGADTASAAREPGATDGTRAEAPIGDAPTPPKPPQVPPRATNPWHQSRPRRSARRPVRKGATAHGGAAALGLVLRLGRIRLPRWRPPLHAMPWLGGALVLAWVGTTSLHPVGAHEQAVVATFGAAGPARGPGLAVSWPWPIGSARIEDVTTVRHLALPADESDHLLLTRDAALIDLAYDVRWRVSDLREHALSLADPDATLRLAADTAMRATVASMDFGAVLGSGREALGHDAAGRLQALLDRYRAGIAIDGIDIRRAEPPARVAEAWRAVATARNDAATEVAQAQIWSRQVVADAQGEAGAFDRVYAQYRLAPAITRQQMYYATMERVLRQSDKLIVAAPGTLSTLPQLAAPSSPAAKAGNAR